jgi:hypothetical protein
MNWQAPLSKFRHPAQAAWLTALAMLALAANPADAVEIWTGSAMTFTNLPGSDPAQPSNQDRITLDVWLTRGATHGLYNAAAEASYSSLSPVGTEWAYGELPNYAALNYQTWVTWNGKNPPSMVGQDAVLHLIPDDVYLAIQFTSWNIGSGGFSYTRSTPPVPEPSPGLLILAGTATLAIFRSVRRRKIETVIYPV